MNTHEYRVVRIDSITPDEKNPRTHPEAQIAKLRASIKRYGFTNPLLIDGEGRLIAGHGRMVAAKLEGMTELPALIILGLTDQQRAALVIDDNQIALGAGWDEQLLAATLKSLDGSEFQAVGFDDAELSKLLVLADNLKPLDREAEWQKGMPEFRQPDTAAFQSIVVHFRTWDDVQAFAKLVCQEGITENTKMIWHPIQERQVTKDKHYVESPVPDLHREQGSG